MRVSRSRVASRRTPRQVSGKGDSPQSTRCPRASPCPWSPLLARTLRRLDYPRSPHEARSAPHHSATRTTSLSPDPGGEPRGRSSWRRGTPSSGPMAPRPTGTKPAGRAFGRGGEEESQRDSERAIGATQSKKLQPPSETQKLRSIAQYIPTSAMTAEAGREITRA